MAATGARRSVVASRSSSERAEGGEVTYPGLVCSPARFARSRLSWVRAHGRPPLERTPTCAPSPPSMSISMSVSSQRNPNGRSGPAPPRRGVPLPRSPACRHSIPPPGRLCVRTRPMSPCRYIQYTTPDTHARAPSRMCHAISSLLSSFSSRPPDAHTLYMSKLAIRARVLFRVFLPT